MRLAVLLLLLPGCALAPARPLAELAAVSEALAHRGAHLDAGEFVRLRNRAEAYLRSATFDTAGLQVQWSPHAVADTLTRPSGETVDVVRLLGYISQRNKTGGYADATPVLCYFAAGALVEVWRGRAYRRSTGWKWRTVYVPARMIARG